MKRKVAILKKPPLITKLSSPWLLATVFYAIAAFWYMRPALTSCSNTVLSMGDSTAGPIWLNSVTNHSLIWGFTNATNFPIGENLWQPVHWSSILLYTFYWVLSHVFGSICSYNILNFVGFVGSAVVMFAFIKWLTRNNWVALLAGFALSFAPYFQTKVSVHPSYGYQMLLVGVLWITLLLWSSKKRLWPISLGVLTAASGYIDPYFILLVGIILIGSLSSLFVINVLEKSERPLLRQRTQRVCLAALVSMTLLIPLLFVRVHYAASINSFVSNSRNDIKYDANIYSSRPIEYLLPPASSPLVEHLPGKHFIQNYQHHGSNTAEFTVYLSWTLLFISFCFIVIILWEKLTRGKVWKSNHGFAINPRTVIVVALTIGLLAFLLSLPPMYLGHKTPTYYLTDYVTIWRVFSRQYVAINIALVIFSSIGITYITRAIALRWIKYVAYLLIFFTVFLSYQTFGITRPTWNYKRDVPPIYFDIKANQSIRNIAEYPLDEPAQTTLPSGYATVQTVHRKNLLNAYLPNSKEALLRNSIRDLNDPQTLPVLRQLGIDTVVTHGAPQLIDNPGLKLIYSDTNISDNPKWTPIFVYEVLPGPKVGYVLMPSLGFLDPLYTNPVSLSYRASDSTTLSIRGLPGYDSASGSSVCLDLRAEYGADTVTITDGDKVNLRLSVSSQNQEVKFITKSNTIALKAESKKTTLLIDNLGCK